MGYEIRTPTCSCSHLITAHDLTPKGHRTACSHHGCPCTHFEHVKNHITHTRTYEEDL